MNASEGIQFIEDMERQGIKPEAAKRIVSLVESQQGELATKADVDQLKEGQKRLEASIDELKEGQKEQRKGNRWAIGLLATAIIGGLTLLGIIITYQNSAIRADIRQLMQIHLNEQQAERTGNSAKPSQEGRISAADQRGS